MNHYDQLHRFLIDDANVRGEIARLDDSLQHIVHSYEYPVQIQKLLGEMAAATCLLTAILKFKGEIGLQIQGGGAVKYAVVNATDEYTLRGVARWDEELASLPERFEDLMEKGVLVITITPEGGERYQGVVALDKPTLAECIENYFAQSEQLATQVKLYTDLSDPERVKAAGMLLQVMPTQAENTNVAQDTGFEHLSTLAETLTSEEVFGLAVEDVLYRLYHQQKVELFEPQSITFACSCSRSRSAEALRNVEKAELLQIIEEEGAVQMNCQYCHTEYRFDTIDVEAIHAGHFDSAPDNPQ
ncbi:Hsp33 family molecular chaperone HslO [Salinimonas chungwhensis]|uniref:Hsp33 family molecular chaperone HslO n=1 Tax=Salinimonas chungwhensis TaxID=265425 RepID=UPI00037006DA|nr:Hsp33 family molecular chaperone HslO [Salinimonas chungwhensis]